MARSVKKKTKTKPKTKAKPKSKKKDLTIAGLREIAPGVAVGDNYKPGADPALDAVIRKLKKDPKSLDSSGLGNRYKI